jgi:hypothetical protein
VQAVSTTLYTERARQLDRELLVHRAPDQLRRLLTIIRMLSWDMGRDAAPVENAEDLGKAAHMNKGDCSRWMREARKMKLLRVLRLGGGWWFELLPDSAVWVERSATKVTKDGKPVRDAGRVSRRAPNSEEVAESRAAWARLEAGGDPAQQTLPIGDKPVHAPLGDGGLGDALADVSREEADAKLGNSQLVAPPAMGVHGKLGNSQLSGQIPNLPKLGNSQLTDAGAGAPEEHVHVPTSVPQSMVHVHGSCATGRDKEEFEEDPSLKLLSKDALIALLCDEGRYWHEELATVFPINWKAYEQMWLMRFCDRWKGEAFDAIGEVKRKQSVGERFKKGPGECANFLFNLYRSQRRAAKRRESAQQSKPTTPS